MDDIGKRRRLRRAATFFTIPFSRAAVSAYWAIKGFDVKVEGTRSPWAMGRVNSTFLRFVQKYQNDRKAEVPICPVGFEYDMLQGELTGVTIRFGEPISADKNLSSLILETKEAIRKLSNL